jgi:hypothetical protein
MRSSDSTAAECVCEIPYVAKQHGLWVHATGTIRQLPLLASMADRLFVQHASATGSSNSYIRACQLVMQALMQFDSRQN